MAEDMRNLRSYITAADHLQYTSLADGTVSVTVTHQYLQMKLIELRFDLHMTIGEIKSKLTTHVGTGAGHMTLLLKRDGQLVSSDLGYGGDDFLYTVLLYLSVSPRLH